MRTLKQYYISYHFGPHSAHAALSYTCGTLRGLCLCAELRRSG